MNHPLRFFRSVCNWGYILFSILRVLTVIGAVALLISVFALSAMPGEFMKLEVMVETEMNFDLGAFLGDSWEEAKSAATLPEGAEWTEDGFTVKETVPSVTATNRALALALIPTFVELILSFSLYLFLCRVFRTLKESPEPLRADVSGNLRGAGWVLMALGAVPALCASLISLLTKTEGVVQSEFDLFLIFMGFLLWALADLFLHAAARLPENTEETGASPFGGYTNFAPSAPTEPSPEVPREPSEKMPEEKSDHHPDAF